MTPAVLYAAKSSPDEKGSTDDQIAQARARALTEGREVVGEFSEQDVSGYQGSRGPQLEAAMQAAIDAAELDGHAELWVFHSSRLARGSGLKAEARSLMEIFTYLRRHGVAIRSVEDDAYVTDEAFIGMASKMANKFSADLSAHTQRGKRAAAKKGRPHGGIAPYGYRYEGRRDECRLVPEPAEAAIVRRIYESYAAGESQLAILRALNADGIPTKRRAPRWAQGTLVAILRNPLYIGKVRHRGEVYDGEHTALIEPELWYRVEALRAAADSRPGRGRGRPPKGPHLFVKGMLRCACGGPMVPRSQPERYCCLTRTQEGPEACSQAPIPRVLIDRAVMHYFEGVGLDVDATREQFRHALDSKLSEIAALRSQAERETMQKAAARERIEGDYIAEQITPQSWEHFRERLDGELKALHAQIAQLDVRERQARDDGDVVDAEAATLAWLAEVRAAIVGDVRSAEGADAMRAALASLFEFALKPVGAPSVEFPVSVVDGYKLEPRMRPEALTAIGEFRALQKIPLAKRENNHSTACAALDLFGPIPIEVA